MRSNFLSAALLLPLAIFLLAGPCFALEVRVDSAGGAPRWLVDGKPVGARVFWGGPGPSNIKATPSGQQVEFEFTASENADTGTMHFRFGAAPGEIFLDDIHVIDLDQSKEVIPRCDFEDGQKSFDRDWTYWPRGAANTTGAVEVVPKSGRDGSAGLRVTLKAPPSGKWPDFHIYHHANLKIVEGHRYRASFWVRAEPARSITTSFYRPGEPYVFLGGPKDCFFSEIQLAAKAGVNFVSFPIDLPWPRQGEAVNWTSADAACKRVLEANPAALLLPRIPMDPPKWWLEANLGEVMQWENGKRDRAVPASPIYRRAAAERLAALVSHLEEKFGDRVAGYHPVGQNTGEWFYEGSWDPCLSGYAPADEQAWRVWLKTRYKTDAELGRAWADANARLDLATTPSPAARHAGPAGVFRDPQKERALIDWADFQQQAMADCVCELAHAARTASHGRKLVLFFYGYVFELAGMHNGAPVSGHYALRRVLDCPDIDVLCSPISYFDRGLGENAPSMTAAESVALAGKMWLNEDDTHTYLATETPPGWQAHVNTIEDTNRELTRNVAQASLRNFGTWWMDLCMSGWFNDDRMWAQMQRLKPLDDAMLKTPTPFCPEVAAVIDERGMLRVSAASACLTWPGIYESRRALGRMGAPFGQYLLDDVLAGRVHAKLYVFLNAWSLSAAERETLLRVTRGSVRVWCHAPGYYDGDTVSSAAMKQLTGFDLREIPRGHFAVKDKAKQPGGLAAIHPLFTVEGAAPGEILSRYPDESPAVAMRRTADGVSIFFGTPWLAPEFLRAAALEAGVHLFTQTNCNVYANGPFVAIHASQDGPVELDVGKATDITDVLTGEVVGHGPKITLQLKRGDTRVLKY